MLLDSPIPPNNSNIRLPTATPAALARGVSLLSSSDETDSIVPRFIALRTPNPTGVLDVCAVRGNNIKKRSVKKMEENRE